MGVKGTAVVTAVATCPPLEEGDGRRITGVFRHSQAVVYDLRVEGKKQPIGVTARHPFWSVDRGEWVPAGRSAC